MVEINYKCTSCDFAFEDKNLIFYIDSNDESLKDKENLEDILNENIDNLELIETSLNKENSDKMSKALIAGFLYENYCPDCMELIRTYVPESNKLFTKEEIEFLLNNEINKNNPNGNDEINKNKQNVNDEIHKNNPNGAKSNYKILFFDFENTFYKDRRNVLENNNCPNCNNEMSLVISEKTPCPKCGEELKEEF